MKRAVEQTVSRFGRLDVAANCAGVGGDMARLEETDQAAASSLPDARARRA
ncbi:hypothetical protein WMF37_49780 [Sorangium sp. So ce291]|uniref:hypothetical protein n=1 Tax=Sorangium sp. So ce291 TaxID=3133294 RepID=UPI003F5FC136